MQSSSEHHLTSDSAQQLPAMTDSRALTFRRASWLTVVAAALFTIWLSLGTAKLWDRDEPRNARCAVEMMSRGDWIVPTFNDQLRTHKPILLYWFQLTSYHLFGQNEFAARFGCAFGASLSVLAICWLCLRHAGRAYAMASGLALASFAMFVVAARAATPDGLLLMTTSVGIVLLAGQLLSSREHATPFWLGYAGYLFLGLAILAKGPVGIVIPLGVIGIWQFLQILQSDQISELQLNQESISHWEALKKISREPMDVIRYFVGLVSVSVRVGIRAAVRMRLARGLLIAFAVSLPWYIWVGVRTDGAWLYGFFVEHNLQRATSAMEGHGGGLWYYPIALLGGTFPWSLMLLPILWWVIRHLRAPKIGSLVQLGVVWVTVTLIVFSCASTKLPSYITTCYPGAALLVGGFFADWIRGDLSFPRWLQVLAGGVLSVISVALVVSIAIAADWLGNTALALHIVWPLGLLIPAALLFLNFDSMNDLLTAGDKRMNAVQRKFEYCHISRLQFAAGSFGIAAVLLTGGLIGQAPGTLSDARSDLQTLIAVGQADEAESPNSANQWLAIGTIEPSWVYYLKHPITEIPRDAVSASGQAKWLETAANHLSLTDARLILSAQDQVLLETYLSARAEQSRSVRESAASHISLTTVARFQRFLKNETLVVVRSTSQAVIEHLARELDQESQR